MNGSLMHWNVQQSGGKCRQSWRSNSAHKNSRYASLHSVTVTEKNCGVPRCREKKQRGYACLRARGACTQRTRAAGAHPLCVRLLSFWFAFFLCSCSCGSQPVLISLFFSNRGANLKEQKLIILTPGLRIFQQRAGKAGDRDTTPSIRILRYPVFRRVSPCVRSYRRR